MLLHGRHDLLRSKAGRMTDGTRRAGCAAMPSIDAPWNIGVWMRKGHSRTRGGHGDVYWLSTWARCFQDDAFRVPVCRPCT